jgi:ribosomal protein L36
VDDVKMSLCPACSNCPEVEIVRRAGEVRIGETGNLAVLNKDAGNTLVDLIQSGQLTRL